MSKQYGLILKKKDDPPARPIYEANRIKREAKVVIDKALEEDPNIFAYDEIYDDMKKKENAKYSKDESEGTTEIKRKSKFINNLILHAEKRKAAEERRIDRKIEKEREAEGDEFADKEIFVTGAYKQKLAERKIYEEIEKKEMELEEMMDVRKQDHGINAFYRNFLSQKVGEKVELKPKEKLLDKMTEDLRRQVLNKDKDEIVKDEKVEFKKSKKSNTHLKRHRRSSSSSEEEQKDDVVIPDLRKGKERKKDSYKSDEHKKIKDNRNESEIDKKKNEKKNEKNEKELEDKQNENLIEKTNENLKDDENKNEIDKKLDEERPIEPEPIKLSLREILTDLFKKKCVGDEFLEQQRRYFERKAIYER